MTDASKAEKAKGPSFPVDTGNGKGPSILDEHLLAMVLDPSGGVFHFNQACQGLTGYTSEEVAGKRPWDFLSSGEESRREEASFKKAMNNAGDQGFEAYWTAKSGARRRIAWSSQAIGNSSASEPSARFLCVGIPLPLQENPDVRLRDSEARMAGIIATAMDAIITIDADQKIVLFNAAAEKMFGYSANEALGMSLDALVPRRSSHLHKEHVAQFGNSNSTVRSMGHLRPLSAIRADGQEFPIEAAISQIQVGGQRLYTAIVRDISQRIRSEQALIEAQARFRVTFDHVAIGILLIDHDWTILDANPATQSMLGYSLEELRALSYPRILHPLDVEDTIARIEAVRNGDQGSCEYEKRYLKKDGTRIWSRVIVSVVKQNEKTTSYFVTIVEDITWRKRMEARKRRVLAANAATQQRLDRLTDRETQVMWLMVEGKPTKIIASELGASPKTIDVHRKRVMEKMQAESIAQLVQMTMPLRRKRTND